MAEQRPISENYASPWLRWGLLREDAPAASHRFELVKGGDQGIPEAFGGGSTFCLATIDFGDDREPVSAWKPCKATGTPDEWNVICAKTLGRALKRCGYPDDVKSLRTLVLWRQRQAEIARIEAGLPPVERPALMVGNGTGEAEHLEDAIEASGRPTGAVGEDDAPDDDHDEPSQSEDEPPSEATLAEMKRAIGALGSRQKEVTAWCKSQGWKVTKPADEAEARAIRDYALSLAGESGEQGELVTDATVMATRAQRDTIEGLVGTLGDDDERAAYAKFCAEQDIDPDDPTEQGADTILAWFGETASA